MISHVFFVSGQYLLADSAYELSPHVIPAYKAPASNLQINSDFNYCLAKSRVRNEHTIGILKSRWASLQEMRLHLYRQSDMREFVSWLYSCIVLHNMLAQLGDQWSELFSDEHSSDQNNSNDTANVSNSAEAFRAKITKQCVEFNYQKGVLPP